MTTVHLILLPKLAKDPPDTLHERDVERLVVVVKVDPSSDPLHRMSPFSRVSHDNLTAGRVVLVDTHIHDVLLAFDVELFVNLVLDGETVSVPAESTFDVETVGPRVTGHHILLCQTAQIARLTLMVPRSK